MFSNGCEIHPFLNNISMAIVQAQKYIAGQTIASIQRLKNNIEKIEQVLVEYYPSGTKEVFNVGIKLHYMFFRNVRYISIYI